MADVGAQLEIGPDDTRVFGVMSAAFRELAKGRLRGLMQRIGAQLHSSSMGYFKAGVGPDGERWAPLKRTPRPKRKDGTGGGGSKPLIDRGHLRKSITYDATDTGVRLGSNLVYAATHQFGDTRTDARGRARNIPARPYLGISDEDRAEIQDMAAEYFRRAF